jgi:hypothetical protein
VSNKEEFTMPSFQQKISRHTKRQENATHEEINAPIKTNSELIQIMNWQIRILQVQSLGRDI